MSSLPIIEPAFCYRETDRSYDKRWTQPDNWDSIDCDASANDVNSHYELRRSVDDRIFDLYRPRLVRFMEQAGCSPRLIKDYFSLMQNYKSNLKFYHEKELVLSLGLIGQLQTGSASTTWTNTMRHISYNRFYQDKAQVPEESVSLHVSGDDQVTFVDPKYGQQLLEILEANNSKDPLEPEIGLGQCIKKFNYTARHESFSFVSKIGLTVGTETVFVRDPVRTILNTNHWSGSEKSISADPFQHSLLVGSSLLAGSHGLSIYKWFADCRLRMGDGHTPDTPAAWLVYKLLGPADTMIDLHKDWLFT